jgi:hypothetical protein
LGHGHAEHLKKAMDTSPNIHMHTHTHTIYLIALEVDFIQTEYKKAIFIQNSLSSALFFHTQIDPSWGGGEEE